MREPSDANIEVEFSYDPLLAGETLTLSLSLDFSGFQFTSQSHLAFVFKILDDKNFILGNAKTDNLILFVNLPGEEVSDD